MKTMKAFIKYYKPYKKLFIMDMLCALILSGIDLVFPLLVGFLMDDVYSSANTLNVNKYMMGIGLVLLTLYIVKYFCQYYITSWGHIMGTYMESDMRRELFEHLEKLSFSYYDEVNTGKLMSCVINDLFDISEFAHHGPEDIFISIVKITGTFLILAGINIKLTLVLMLFTIMMIYFSLFYNKKMKKVFAKNREKIASVNAITQDSLGGIRVVKSFANEKVELEKFEKGNEQFVATKKSSYFIMGNTIVGIVSFRVFCTYRPY